MRVRRLHCLSNRATVVVRSAVNPTNESQLSPTSVTGQLNSSIFRKSPTCGNPIVSDTRIGGRQVPFLDPHHVAVPPRLCLKPCQPEFRRARWLVTIPPCPTSEPDVRDALWEDKVIDVLSCSVVIRIGHSVEVAAAFLVTPRKRKRCRSSADWARSLSRFSRAQSSASIAEHTCASSFKRKGIDPPSVSGLPCLLRACPFTHQARGWG